MLATGWVQRVNDMFGGLTLLQVRIRYCRPNCLYLHRAQLEPDSHRTWPPNRSAILAECPPHTCLGFQAMRFA